MLEFLRNQNETYSEAPGFYDNIPNRVGKWVTEENTEDQLTFMTTDPEICDGETETKVQLSKKDDGWIAHIHEAGAVSVLLNTVDQIENMEIARKRAFWHVKKFMEGVSMTSRQRYTDTYTIMNSNPEPLHTVDPYFHAKTEIQNNPFKDYLND